MTKSCKLNKLDLVGQMVTTNEIMSNLDIKYTTNLTNFTYLTG
jgi:hypothetical protein